MVQSIPSLKTTRSGPTTHTYTKWETKNRCSEVYMLLRHEQRTLLFHQHGMALRVQLVRSLHHPPTLLHADSGQARLCFTVPEIGSELLEVLASSPPHLSRDVQASLSHAYPQDSHFTDGRAFLSKRRHDFPDTSDVFVAPEDLFIDSSKGAEPAQHKQIGERKDPFRYHLAEGRAEGAIASLLPRRTRRRTRQRECVAVKPARAEERRVRQRSRDARGQFHVHFEAVQQL
jgi:hypothetical protein